MGRVHSFREVTKSYPGGDSLCFQQVIYVNEGQEEPEPGFRFIWRTKENRLKSHRGQACIPDLKTAEYLIGQMKQRLQEKRT